MNKKQLAITLMLVGLMLVLVFIQRFFDNSVREVVLVDSNMGQLKNYTIDNKGISFSLPDKWSSEEKDSNDYSIYKVEFKDSENSIMGYIELLKCNEDIKDLAQKDVNNMVLSHDTEKIEAYKSVNRAGIRVEYKTKVNKGYSFINTSYYMPLKDGFVGKCTFISKESSYKDNLRLVYNSIVDSISIK